MKRILITLLCLAWLIHFSDGSTLKVSKIIDDPMDYSCRVFIKAIFNGKTIIIPRTYIQYIEEI